MPIFVEAVSQGLRTSVCAALQVQDNVRKLLDPLVVDPLTVFDLGKAVRRLLCSDDPDNDAQYDPPFDGGQCPVNYNVQVLTTQYNTLGEVVSSGTNNVSGILGPISGVDYDSACSGTIIGPLAPSAGGFCGYLQGAAERRLVAGNGNGGVLLQITGLSRVDAGSDNCGDVPPGPITPGPVNVDTDITYEIDEGIDITVPFGLIFAPAYIAPNFDIKIPVDITVDGVEFSGEITVAPEIKVEFKPKGIRRGPGNPDDDFGDDTGVDDPTPAPEDDEDVEPIIAVLVYSNFDGDPNSTGVISEGGPTIHVPRIGSVQFGIKTGNSIAWTSDQDIKSREAYIPCLVPQGAIAVRVTPSPGVESVFTPVRGRPLTTL